MWTSTFVGAGIGLVWWTCFRIGAYMISRREEGKMKKKLAEQIEAARQEGYQQGYSDGYAQASEDEDDPLWDRKFW